MWLVMSDDDMTSESPGWRWTRFPEESQKERFARVIKEQDRK